MTSSSISIVDYSHDKEVSQTIVPFGSPYEYPRHLVMTLDTIFFVANEGEV
jgi:hypothetical protein